MAEAGHDTSELFPKGSTIQSDSTIVNDIIIPLLKSPAEPVKDHIKPEDLRQSLSEVPCSANIVEDGDHVKAKMSVDNRTAADKCVPVRSAQQSHSIAEVCISDKTNDQKGDGLNHEYNQASLSTMVSLDKGFREQKLALTEVSVQMSQSDNLQIQQKDLTPVLHCDSSEPICPGTNQISAIPSLVCKQAMQPQSSSATIFCKAGSISSNQQRSMPTGPSSPGQVSGHSRFEDFACCSPYHHGAAEDTFAAYCHPQPIPAPAQLLPRITSIEGDLKGSKGGPNFLTLPPLISSISETRLDAKRLTHCCSLDCNWSGSLHQAGKQTGRKEIINMRDAGTMTSCMELRDMAVQVGQSDPEMSSQHVYPKVCLVDERKNGNHKFSAQNKSPVKEVKWDAEGMTWEVYGASVDPEELGLAIQKHLELQIKETAGLMISQQNPNTSQPDKEKSQKRRRGVMEVLRRPSVCCSRSSTAAD